MSFCLNLLFSLPYDKKLAFIFQTPRGLRPRGVIIHQYIDTPPVHLSHHTCPVRKNFFNEISKVSYVGSDRKNPWNQTLGNFWENSILIFCNVKNWPIFANFEPFFPSNSILLIFWIEWMFPKCSQILVQDFRHQNFGIWIILGWVMAIFVKNIGKITKLLCKGAKNLFAMVAVFQYKPSDTLFLD